MRTRNLTEIIPSISIAVMLCSRSLTELINFPLSSVIILVLTSIISFIFSRKNILLNKNIAILISYILFFLLVGISIGRSFVPTEYLLYFSCFGILPSLITLNIKFDVIYKSIIIIGLILLYPYYTIDYSANLYDSAQKYMDMSYKVLIFIITGFLCFFLGFSKLYKTLALIVTSGYLVLFLSFGSRGAIVSLFAFLAIYWIISARSKNKMINRLLMSMTAMIAVSLAFKLIIVNLYEFLSDRNTEILAISRIFQMLEDGKSMSTGRDYLAEIALTGIYHSPLFGKGIGSFDNYSGLYPHNIILQLMWEGGILLTMPIISCFLTGISSIFNNCLKIEFRIFLLLLFSSGIIQLFFSSYLWMSLFLWLFIWLTIRKSRYKLYNK